MGEGVVCQLRTDTEELFFVLSRQVRHARVWRCPIRPGKVCYAIPGGPESEKPLTFSLCLITCREVFIPAGWKVREAPSLRRYTAFYVWSRAAQGPVVLRPAPSETGASRVS